MLDQKPNEALMSAERRAMNTERRLLGVVLVFVNEIEPARLREIDLVGRDRKFAPDHAPRLHVDLRSVKGRFIWHFNVIDAGIIQNVTRHFLGLFPKLRFIDKLLTKFGWIMRRETHLILVDSEELEIIQIHFVHAVELGLELFRRHVKMCVVHLHRAHPHQSDQFAALLVAITGSVLRQSQWQIAIAPRHRPKQLVMMRTIHRLEIITVWLRQLRPLTLRKDCCDRGLFEENLALFRLLPEISLKFFKQIVWFFQAREKLL